MKELINEQTYLLSLNSDSQISILLRDIWEISFHLVKCSYYNLFYLSVVNSEVDHQTKKGALRLVADLLRQTPALGNLEHETSCRVDRATSGRSEAAITVAILS